ncbi:hypothetical protein HYFRA_00011667 [Hymenoscyphus fraxineus]|uniref:Uncharacterized protein n=1 Tax=Hymenoscyphus fraxineus TaxID=746836 RepID=A0A9N9L081_9HELO|nr:hypothetical protein HYFRA_00011667 [Hymenoscyphus fraxineus]
MRSSSPCEAAEKRRHSIVSTATTAFPQRSPISIQCRRSLRKHKRRFEGEEEVLSHASFTSGDGSPKSSSMISYREDPWVISSNDISSSGFNDLETREKATSPSDFTSLIAQREAPPSCKREVSNLTPPRLSMRRPSIESPSTRLSNHIFDPENFERQLQDIREANPFWFSPLRASTLPPSYESPWTERSNKTLNPEQFKEHLENIQRDTNMFSNLEVLEVQDFTIHDLDWDSTPEVATPSSTGSFEARGFNSPVHGKCSYLFDELTAKKMIDEKAEKASHRDLEKNQVSFEEIFQMHQEPQAHLSPSPKRKREAFGGHGGSVDYRFPQQGSPQLIPRKEGASLSAEFVYSNPLTTTKPKRYFLSGRESQDEVNPSSSPSSPPPKRRRVDSEEKNNGTPSMNEGNKAIFSVWSNGKTGSTKRRFLRKRRTQYTPSCITNQSVASPQKENECQNPFKLQDATFIVSSPVKVVSKPRGHQIVSEFGDRAKLTKPFRTGADSSPNSLASHAKLTKMNHNKAVEDGFCHPSSIQKPFKGNASDFNFPSLKVSSLSAEQYTTPSPVTTIVNIALGLQHEYEDTEEFQIDLESASQVAESSESPEVESHIGSEESEEMRTRDHVGSEEFEELVTAFLTREESPEPITQSGPSSGNQNIEPSPYDWNYWESIALQGVDRIEREAQAAASHEAQRQEREEIRGPDDGPETQLREFRQFYDTDHQAQDENRDQEQEQAQVEQLGQPPHYRQIQEIISEGRNLIEDSRSQQETHIGAEQPPPQPQELWQETLSGNGDAFDEFRAHITPGFSSNELSNPSSSSMQTRRRGSTVCPHCVDFINSPTVQLRCRACGRDINGGEEGDVRFGPVDGNGGSLSLYYTEEADEAYEEWMREWVVERV